MSVKIRLKKMGSKGRPFYRIVVMDTRQNRDGRAIDELGYYHPIMKAEQVKIDVQKTKEWLSKGALPTGTVKNIMNKNNILLK